MKYFISHSSKDIDSVEVLVRTIEDYEKDTGEQKCVFCSSIPENGSDFKEELITNINNNISLAENIILVITENYLRSSFCFYEMSLAR
ncbi:MAG: toll/interleukin-1 receptor domain-containing protein, partial [Clostridia bacterium]|nr:toll/interleukin-1 receptor domain-containing protein [Clostridia bacterium]